MIAMAAVVGMARVAAVVRVADVRVGSAVLVVVVVVLAHGDQPSLGGTDGQDGGVWATHIYPEGVSTRGMYPRQGPQGKAA
ncbi:hypothetical protein GCM10027059_44900 [Myceligenerans halotolerans]